MTKHHNALIGYTGFVGSNLHHQTKFECLYNSSNIEEITGRQFDQLVFAGAQAKKWWANAEPEADWAGIERALSALRKVQASHVIHISSVDVVPKRPGVNESDECDEATLDAYGRHRLRLENELKDLFERVTIVRLPGLFGQGLKKNVIYDLITHNQVEKINPESVFQYYCLDSIWKDISVVCDNGIELIHFATEPIATKEILSRFFSDLDVGASPYPTVTYDFKTIHDSVFGRTDGYMTGKSTLLEQLDQFVTTNSEKRP